MPTEQEPLTDQQSSADDQATLDTRSRMMGRIVVAGGAGFVGQQLVRDLVLRGECPLVLDNCSRGSQENLPGEARLIQADVRAAYLEGILQDCDVLYDFAARVYGVRDLYSEPGTLLADNVEMTIALLRGATKAKVRKYVYVSSSCIYDHPTVQVPHLEDDIALCDTSYGFGKLAGEQLVKWFARQYGMPTHIVRLFNVYGPRDSFQSPHVIPEFLTKAWRVKTGRAATFPILGSGSQTRDFTWLGDASAAILAVAAIGRDGEAYNVATGREISVGEVARLACQTVGLDPGTVRFTHEPAPPEDIQRRAGDITKIFRETGWTPGVTLEAGLRVVADWLLPLLESGRA